VLLLLFVGVAPLADLLGGSWPTVAGWLFAVLGAAVIILADAAQKGVRARSHARAAQPHSQASSTGPR
jgi:protein-S-isoprenylcysteine O-methyltransferase Ste14